MTPTNSACLLVYHEDSVSPFLHRTERPLRLSRRLRFLQARTEKQTWPTIPDISAWYELMTTDVAAAAAFYRDVVGWGTQGSFDRRSCLMCCLRQERLRAAGLIELPEEGRKMGATPRWMGYVGVRDVNAAADRIKRLGGAVYVPPTDTNIGRISVVADPHTATFGVIDRLQVTPQLPTDFGKPGRIGWHELFAADLDKEVAFYCELFGWQRAHTENHLADAYVSLSAGGQVIGGAFKKPPRRIAAVLALLHQCRGSGCRGGARESGRRRGFV